MSEGFIGAESILTHTSFSLTSVAGMSTSFVTASGWPCDSYMIAFDGGDTVEENACVCVFRILVRSEVKLKSEEEGL